MFETQITTTTRTSLLPRMPALGIARQGLLGFAVKVAGAGIAIVLQVFLARMLGGQGYGDYAYVVAWMQLLLLFAQSGLSMSAVRYVAEYSAQRQTAFVRGFVRRSTQTAAISSLALAAVLYSAALIVDHPNQQDFLLAALTLPALALFALDSSIIRGLGEALLGMSTLLLYPSLMLVGVACAHQLIRRPLSPTDGLTLNLIAACAAMALTFRLRRRLMSQLVEPGPNSFQTYRWLLTSAELVLVSGLTFLQVRAGVLFTGWFLDSQATGTFAILERMADAALLGMISVEQLVAPRFSSLHASAHREELERCARLAAWGATSVTVAVATVLALFGKPVLAIFGPEFVTGYGPLMIMLVGVTTKAVCGSAGLLLCMTGHQRDSMLIASASLLLNVILSWLLIPRFGIYGTALAFTASLVTWNVTMLFVARWRLGIWSCLGRLLLPR